MQEKKQSEINKLSADEKAKQAELDAYNAKLKEIDDAIAEALRKAQEEEKKIMQQMVEMEVVLMELLHGH